MAPTLRVWRERGVPRSFILGTAFAVAWSPCIGPILGVVLTLAAASGTAAQGALLLLAYSAGLGIWFLAFGAFFGWIAPRLRRLGPYLPRLAIGAGLLFIVLGFLMIVGEFQRLNAAAQRAGFLFSVTAETEGELSSSVAGGLGPAIAFLGGVVSFLSPCVLPLVPAYLVNMAGEAVLETGDARASRAHVLRNAGAFVLGFGVVFTAVGASAGFAGTLVSDHVDTLGRVGGLVLVVMGLQMSELLHLPYLNRTFQVRV